MKKRIALSVVAALAGGLLVAAPASAAPGSASTLGTVTTSVPTIVRTGYTNAITVSHADLSANALTGAVGLAVLQSPTGSTITLESSNSIVSLAADTVFDFNTDKVGTYVLRPYFEGTAAGTYDAGTDTLVGSQFTVNVVGAPAAFTFASSAVSAGPAGEKSVAVNVVDAAGNATLLGSSFISISVTDSTATTAAVVSTTSGGSGQVAQLTGTNAKIYIKDADAASSVVVSGLLSVAGTSAQTVTYTTVAYSATEPTDATLATPATGNFVATGTTALARTYSSSLGTSSFTATVTGLDASKAFKAAVAVSGSVTASIDNTAPVADANGVGTVVITTSGAATTDTVTLTVDKSDTANTPAGTIVLTYSTPAAAFSSTKTSPAGSTSTFTAGGAAKTITATIKDQYGQPINGAYAVASYTTVPSGVTAPTIASATAVAGVATLSTTIPSTVGTYVITVTAKDASGSTIGTTSAITYIVTATGGPGALAISSGVNTSTAFYAVTVDADGVDGAGASAASQTTAALATANPGAYTTVVVNVKDDAAAAVQNALVVATPGAGVFVSSVDPSGATEKFSAFNGSADLSIKTDGSGNATFYVFATKQGTATVSFAAGTSTVSGSFAVNTISGNVGRAVSLDKVVAQTAGAVTQVTATVTDAWGNALSGASLSGGITGTAGRFTGGARTTGALTTDAKGQVVFEVTSLATEAGTGILTVTLANPQTGDLSGNLATLGAAEVASATAAITVTAAPVVKSAEVLAAEAAQAAAVKAGTDAVAAAAAAKAAADAAAAAAAKAGVDAAAAAAAAGVKADAATAAAKAASDAVAALSTSVASLQTTVASLVASMTAQIKVINSSLLKIAKKLGIAI